MNKDRIEGAATDAFGKIEKTIGDMTGDKGMQSDGLIDQAKGKAQNLYGNAKDAVDAALDNASPAVRDGAERAFGNVKAHPLLTALFAGTVGFAIALTLNGGKSEEPRTR